MATPDQIREMIKVLQDRIYMLDYIKQIDGDLSIAEKNEYDHINQMLSLPGIIEYVNVANPEFNPHENNLINIEDVCSICLNNLEIDICRNTCGHLYHCNCINTWANISNTCPVCRAPLNLVQININHFGKKIKRNKIKLINNHIRYLKK